MGDERKVKEEGRGRRWKEEEENKEENKRGGSK